ncbi:MAG TPA: acetylglutamate kinase [Cyclobacteriaceae bacterium]|nr:acetylglutamate kinase [Cyclobacteriaceae bacterium]
MEKIAVIKIGGKVIDNPDQLRFFLKSFAGFNMKKVLVHGGGKMIDQICSRLGIKVRMTGGRRITDDQTLEVVQMVLAGLINKNIVSILQGWGCNALGLTGADGNLITSDKRPVRDGIDFGRVGDVREVNLNELEYLITGGYVPIVASLTHDGRGSMLNTNADTIASVLAQNLSERYETDLVYCFEQAGVLNDIRDESSVIPQIRLSDFESLKSTGRITEGMIPKIENALSAVRQGVKRVYITNINNAGEYLSGRKTDGTLIIK